MTADFKQYKGYIATPAPTALTLKAKETVLIIVRARFLGKSMLETKEFFWAWLIHFLPDALIFTFLAMFGQ